MDEFVVIKVMNEAMLRLRKSKNEDYTINEKIKEYLEDETLFFKISKNNAIRVLTSIGIANDKKEETYQKLTNPKMYYKLVKEGKIHTTDNLTVKYD